MKLKFPILITCVVAGFLFVYKNIKISHSFYKNNNIRMYSTKKNRVNLYIAPSYNSSVIAIIEQMRTPVKVNSCKNSWCKVAVLSVEGFMPQVAISNKATALIKKDVFLLSKNQIVGVIKKDVIVNLIDRSKDMLKVSYQNMTGWISQDACE